MVRLDDVGVDEVCDEFGFADEIFDEDVLVGEALANHFDGDAFNEITSSTLLRFVDNSHPAFAQLASDIVSKFALDREQPRHAAILREHNLKSRITMTKGGALMSVPETIKKAAIESRFRHFAGVAVCVDGARNC